jgi:4-amino-4-deoxy-L-arabinose transferase-like glycosyltransferase
MTLSANKWFDSPRTLKLAGFGLLLALSLTLRLYRLDAFGLWLDETIQYGFSDRPIDQLMSNVPGDWMFLPLLITKAQIIAHLDNDAWQLRLPYVAFGVLTVLAIFLLAREMFDERVAWLATFLAALWPRLVEYSQDLRAYALFALLATIAGYALLRALRTNHAGAWALFVAASLLELYNHHLAALNVFAFFLCAAMWIFAGTIAIVRSSDSLPVGIRIIRRPIGMAIASFIGMGIGFLPVLGSYAHLFTQPRINRWGSLRIDSNNLSVLFGSYLGLGLGFRLIVLCSFVLIGFAYACVRFRDSALLAALWIIVPVAFAAMSDGGNLFKRSPRYLLFLIPVLLPLLAAGIVCFCDLIGGPLRRRWLAKVAKAKLQSGLIATAGAGIVVMAVPSLVTLYKNNPKQIPVDLRSAYGYIVERATTNDVVLGLGAVTEWDATWFQFTDMYFLRQSVNPPVRKVIPIGAGASYLPVPFADIDRKTGRLFAILPVTPAVEPNVEKAAAGEFTTVCWENVCVVESILPLPMSAQLDAVLRRFAPLNPADLNSLLELHQKSSRSPSP